MQKHLLPLTCAMALVLNACDEPVVEDGFGTALSIVPVSLTASNCELY